MQSAEHSAVDLIDLRDAGPGSLDDLLEEENAAWQRNLHWDFASSAVLLKRFVDMGSLPGRALVADGMVIGYTYTVVEEHKGLIGDLYILEEFASQSLADRLLEATVESLVAQPGIRRIEGQVILLPVEKPSPGMHRETMKTFNRSFMVCDLDTGLRWPAGRASGALDIENWQERYQEDAAALITAAYTGHVDSHINDQYRSLPGARRFVQNVVQYPGCGAFTPDASFLSWRRDTGRLCGMSLASVVANGTGHITQVCVSPDVRGEGVGYELMARSLAALAAQGCRRVSLTVTSSNRGAIRLYEQMGFVTRRTFPAMVWDGLRPPRRFF